MTRCGMRKRAISFVALLLVLSFLPFDALACVDWTARDESFWKRMYREPRSLLFPLEPILLPASSGLSRVLNEDGIKALRRGDYGQAEKKFSEAAGIDPGSAPLQHNLALVAYKKLDLERAAGLWKKAVLLDSSSPRYIYHLAFALFSSGHIQEAIERYGDLLRKMNGEPEIYNNLGQLFEFRGDVAQAEKNFRRAVTLDPRYLPALNNLGRLYEKSGRLKEAEQVFRMLARLTPEDVENYRNLGDLYSQMGKKHEAARYYRKAIRLREDYPELHLLLAGVYRAMGQTGKAHNEEVLAHAVTCRLRPNME